MHCRKMGVRSSPDGVTAFYVPGLHICFTRWLRPMLKKFRMKLLAATGWRVFFPAFLGKAARIICFWFVDCTGVVPLYGRLPGIVHVETLGTGEMYRCG